MFVDVVRRSMNQNEPNSHAYRYNELKITSKCKQCAFVGGQIIMTIVRDYMKWWFSLLSCFCLLTLKWRSLFNNVHVMRSWKKERIVNQMYFHLPIPHHVQTNTFTWTDYSFDSEECLITPQFQRVGPHSVIDCDTLETLPSRQTLDWNDIQLCVRFRNGVLDWFKNKENNDWMHSINQQKIQTSEQHKQNIRQLTRGNLLIYIFSFGVTYSSLLNYYFTFAKTTPFHVTNAPRKHLRLSKLFLLLFENNGPNSLRTAFIQLNIFDLLLKKYWCCSRHQKISRITRNRRQTRFQMVGNEKNNQQ